MNAIQLGGSIEDPENPGCDMTTGEYYELWSGKPIQFDDKINQITVPGDLVRLCVAVVKNHQYIKFHSSFDGPRQAKYFMLDAITANTVYTRWGQMGFGVRRKLLKAIRNRGPISILCMFAGMR